MALVSIQKEEKMKKRKYLVLSSNQEKGGLKNDNNIHL